MAELTDSIIDQVLWRFVQRQPRLARQTVDVKKPFAELLDRDVWRDDPDSWRAGTVWVLAILEVFASAGCIEGRVDRRVYNLARTLSELPSRSYYSTPTWRLGLVRDYLARTTDDGELAGTCSEECLYRVSELNALVDEFEASENGHAFLSWAHTPIRVDSGWQLRRAKGLVRRLVTDEQSFDSSTPLVIFGATEYLQLLDNYYACLTELSDAPELMSACWAFHGTLFEDRKALFAALSLNPRVGETEEAAQSPEAEIETARAFAGKTHTLTEDINQLARNAAWEQLTHGQEWVRGRSKAQWSDILGNLP